MREKRGKINKRTIVNGALCQTLQDQQKLLILTSHTLSHTLLLLRLLEGLISLYKHMLTHTHAHTLFAVKVYEGGRNTLLTLSNMDGLQNLSLHRGANGHKVQSCKMVSSVQQINFISPVNPKPAALTAVR